jgi:hypothetical protein
MEGGKSLMKNTVKVCVIVLLLICGNQLWAQDQADFAPVGQKLAEELLAKHQPDLLYVGLHVVPPGRETQVFVAATGKAGLSKIGHESSCTDLWELENGDGAPALELKGGGGSMVKGVLMGTTAIVPLRDQSGATIGLINLGLKFTLGEESEAVKFATGVGQELAAEIPSRAALFQGNPRAGQAGVREKDSFQIAAVGACPTTSARSSAR